MFFFSEFFLFLLFFILAVLFIEETVAFTCDRHHFYSIWNAMILWAGKSIHIDLNRMWVIPNRLELIAFLIVRMRERLFEHLYKLSRFFRLFLYLDFTLRLNAIVDLASLQECSF